MKKNFLILAKKFFNRPLWVLLLSCALVGAHLIFDGSFLQMWRLYNSRQALEYRIKDLQTKNGLVEERLKKLSDSDFLEKEVRNRFNLAGEEDLIFIFSNDNKPLRTP